MSGLYNGIVSDNTNTDDMLKAIGFVQDDFDRIRDIDIPPYDRFRQIPLFTDIRFADKDKCKDMDKIIVLTRTGGHNRNDHKQNWEKIRSNKYYVCDYDASFDNTYAYIEFKVEDEKMRELEKLDIDVEPEIEKIISTNMNIARQIMMITGEEIDEKELYEKCKIIALETLMGPIDKGE